MKRVLIYMLIGIAICTTAFAGSVDLNPLSLTGSGQTTVSSAGTAVAVGGGQISNVLVRANADNAGNVYLGISSVYSTTGLILAPGEYVSLDINDLADLYVDAANNGDGVSYITLK